MKFFSIDEDTMNALMELLSDAYIAACDIGDGGSEKFYSYLLGELESAKCIGATPPLAKEEELKMKKIERYLRMLQEGLKDPNNDFENKKRRKFARDILDGGNKKQKPFRVEVNKIEPFFSKNMSLENIEKIIKNMDNLSDMEKFELYYKERETRNSKTLDEICKEVGIKRYKENEKK